MKRIRKIIASALTLVMSILVMCVGVYAATSAPKVGISGSISYDVGACKVRVVGNLYGAYSDANGSGINEVEKTATDNNGQACHYYGEHANAQSETNMLPDWDIGNVYFKETSDGAESFVILFKIENLSNYPIKAIINTSADEVLTNVEKEVGGNEAFIDFADGNSSFAMVLGLSSVSQIYVKYSVKNSALPASLTIGNELTFEKTTQEEYFQLENHSGLVGTTKNISLFHDIYQAMEEPDEFGDKLALHMYANLTNVVGIDSHSKVTLTLSEENLGGFRRDLIMVVWQDVDGNMGMLDFENSTVAEFETSANEVGIMIIVMSGGAITDTADSLVPTPLSQEFLASLFTISSTNV